MLSGSRLEYAWVAFAVANLGAMGAIIDAHIGGPGWETVPFHFIYISFALLYGFRAWQQRGTVVGILFVTLSTGVLTLIGIHAGWEGTAEFSEVPLMSLMFLAMVYHVRRRQQAIAIAEALAAERARDLERQSQFVSDASHELLTPITIGRGHLEVLAREPDISRPELDETCQIVLEELDRMSRVIGRLLLLESAGSEGPGVVSPLDAAALVTGFHVRWAGTAEREWSLGEVAAGTIRADSDQLTLALDALVENAVQHTAPGAEIAVSSFASGGELVIRVRDAGTGMAADELPRIFDRFYRIDRGRNRRHGGAGLGLAIVKAIVEAHGGRVTVTSRPGTGSTFEVHLPGLRSAGNEPVAATPDGLDHRLGLELAP